MKENCIQSHLFPLAVFVGIFGLMTGAKVFFMQPTVSIGDQNWRVEVAKTSTERELGLGYRDSLCQGCGMLFLFKEPGYHGFWMKGMKFPLDLIFIDNHRVISVEKHISPDTDRIMYPSAPVDKVLEVNEGGADDILPGMEVIFSF